MAEKLKPIIINQSTFTGKAADWNLLAKNYGGSLAQLTGIDQIQRSDQSKDIDTANANYNDVLRYVNDNSSPDLTQAAKTLKAQIVYATARGLSNGQRLNLPEIKSANDMLGESGDKKTYLTGISQTQQNLLNSAIRNYNFYHTDIKLLFNSFASMFRIIEAAGGLVQNKDKKFLFIFRNGKWDLPKGKIERNEKKEDAAIREVEEECGLTSLKITEPLTITYHIYSLEEKLVLKRTYWFNMNCNYSGKLIPQHEEGITKAEWISKKNFKKVFANTYESILEVINSVV